VHEPTLNVSAPETTPLFTQDPPTQQSKMVGELKRVGFVKTYAVTATNLAGSAYATAKTMVPKQLSGTFESVESTVVAKAAPIASWAIGKGEAVLDLVDAQVSDSRGGSVDGGAADGARLAGVQPREREGGGCNACPPPLASLSLSRARAPLSGRPPVGMPRLSAYRNAW